MNLVKKHKFAILCGVGIIFVYLFLRLYHLLNLPIFTDEAIYVRWSQIARQDANWRFISLTDGKQPMFVWIDILLLHFFHDPLYASRIVSVIAGFASTVGLFFLGAELFKNKWIGIISSFLYVIYPFGLVYDRIALYDSLVAAFAVWGWYFIIVMVRRMRSHTPYQLALILGGGFLTKSSNFFIAALMPISLLLFNFKQKDAGKKLLQWCFYAVLSVFLAILYYSVLRLSPFYGIINEKNALFVYPVKEWFQHPFTFFYGNLKGLLDWFITYVKLPFIVLIIGSFIFYKEFLKEKLVLVIWFLIPFIYLAFFGKVLYPRFILFMTVTLLPLAAYTLFTIMKKSKKIYFGIVMFFLFTCISILADFKILTDFPHAPIPYSDLTQYINAWPAGGGVKESVSFFHSKAKNGKIYIATEGTFGLMPYALEIYLVSNPNITIKGLWPITSEMPKELTEAGKKMPTYVIFYQPCPDCKSNGDAPVSWPLTKIASYQRGIGNDMLTIYQVKK